MHQLKPNLVPLGKRKTICMFSDSFFFFSKPETAPIPIVLRHSRLYSATFRRLPNLANGGTVIRCQREVRLDLKMSGVSFIHQIPRSLD